jgi:TonB-dependent receptor
MLAAGTAAAQDGPDEAPPTGGDQTGTTVSGSAGEEEIVITGFRGSVAAAIEDKREASGVVDVIRAEDIADFPDNNLAESIQRVPGVAIARDAGEGRSISVRGLGPAFTRVRINGMEAIATTGSSDAGGGVNRTRGFDFNVFASELFNSITVRKTASADVEEGSLGATVDLATARPLDNRDPLVIAGSAQVGYNDKSEKFNPRVAGLLSWHTADRTFGVLVSGAYSERTILETGHSTVRWSPTGANGGFNAASTLPGFALADINRPAASDGSNWDQLIYHPRIPRYDTWNYSLKRLGLTGSIQWQPADGTLLTIDGLYSDSDTKRAENYIEAISFSRTGAGKPQTIILDGEVNEDNELVYGVFDNVDMRVEARQDEMETEFHQYTANLSHAFSDAVRVNAFAGYAKSAFSNPVQTTITLDRLNTDGYSWDYRNDDREPVIGLGFDPTDPANWVMVNGSSDIRIRPQFVDNSYKTGKLSGEWDVVEGFTIEVGGEYRKFKFNSREYRRLVAETQSPTLTPTQVAELSTVFGGLTGDPQYGSYLIPNFDAFIDALDIYCDCVQSINGQNIDFRLGGIENVNARSNWATVTEEQRAAFFQVNFEYPIAGITLRGDAGMRYVQTRLDSIGFAGVTAGTPPVTSIEQLQVKRKYDDWLPALNIAAEITPDVILRFSTAKVITRPGLGALSPGGSFTAQASNRVYNAGNPFLDPTEATNFDLSAEWYFAPGSLLAVGLFQKNISTLSGTAITVQVPFTELGLPEELLAGTGVTPDQLFDYRRFVNGEGGKLKGFEVNYQHQLRFLPSFLSNLGVLANYTYVKANIDYPGPGGVGTVNGPLLNLSKESANATLFYEDDVFSIRGSAAYRSGNLTAFAGGARESSTEEGINSTLNFDASASLKLTDNITLTLEALNLTDEPQDQYIDEDDQVVLFHRTGRQFWGGVRVRF